MSQDDAIGQILVVERMSGMLHMRHIASADLMDTDVDDYEMVIFDGGNTSGDTWKHRVLSASARALLRVPSLTSGPFRGAFSLYAAQECGHVARCRFLRAGRPPWAMLTPCPSALPTHAQAVETFEGCKHGKPCWSFLPTDLPRPSTPPTRDLSPCGRGIPCYFSRSFPMDRSSSNP